MERYNNRYGDQYWFEPLDESRYIFRMSGDSMKWCRYGGHENQESVDLNDLGMFDPSGGPYIDIGTVTPVGEVKRIQQTDEGIILTVG